MNPTNVEAFEFALWYEWTGDDPSDPSATWTGTRYVLGEGQAGLDQALAELDNIQSYIDAGYVTNVRAVAVRYASIQTWTDWQTEGGSLSN